MSRVLAGLLLAAIFVVAVFYAFPYLQSQKERVETAAPIQVSIPKDAPAGDDKKLAEQAAAAANAPAAEQAKKASEALTSAQARLKAISSEASAIRPPLSPDDAKVADNCFQLVAPLTDRGVTEKAKSNPSDFAKTWKERAELCRDQAEGRRTAALRAQSIAEAEKSKNQQELQKLNSSTVGPPTPATMDKQKQLQQAAQTSEEDAEKEKKKAEFWNRVIKIAAVALIVVGVVLIATGAGAYAGAVMVALGLSILFTPTDREAGPRPDTSQAQKDIEPSAKPIDSAEKQKLDQAMTQAGFQPVATSGGDADFALYQNAEQVQLYRVSSQRVEAQIMKAQLKETLCDDKAPFVDRLLITRINSITAGKPTLLKVMVIDNISKKELPYDISIVTESKWTAKGEVPVRTGAPWCS